MKLVNKVNPKPWTNPPSCKWGIANFKPTRNPAPIWGLFTSDFHCTSPRSLGVRRPCKRHHKMRFRNKINPKPWNNPPSFMEQIHVLNPPKTQPLYEVFLRLIFNAQALVVLGVRRPPFPPHNKTVFFFHAPLVVQFLVPATQGTPYLHHIPP